NAGFLSFGFSSLAALAAAQCALARSELVSASYGFDRLKASLATRSMSQADGARTLYRIARSGSPVAGAVHAAKAALSGTGFLDRHPFTLHLTMEEASAEGLADCRSQILRMMAGFGAVSLPPTVPQALHASPFGPLRGMLGPDGERWVPVHALFPLSASAELVDRWEAFIAGHAGTMQAHGIQLSLLT